MILHTHILHCNHQTSKARMRGWKLATRCHRVRLLTAVIVNDHCCIGEAPATIDGLFKLPISGYGVTNTVNTISLISNLLKVSDTLHVDKQLVTVCTNHLSAKQWHHDRITPSCMAQNTLQGASKHHGYSTLTIRQMEHVTWSMCQTNYVQERPGGNPLDSSLIAGL